MRTGIFVFVGVSLIAAVCFAAPDHEAGGGTGEAKSYGQAFVDRIISIEEGYSFRCDVKQWPAVIGNGIDVRINDIVPPLVVTNEGKSNKFFQLQTKSFLEKTLNSAKVIELENIKRAPTFSLVADVIVDGNSLADVMIKNALARRYIADIGGRPKSFVRHMQDSSPTPSSSNVRHENSPDPDSPAESVWFASKNSKVFHCSTCRFAKGMSQKNAIEFTSRPQAIQSGRRPCKTCNP